MNLLIQLLLAHLIGDFILQPKSWVDQRENLKIKSKFLYVHIIVHFLAIILIVWDIHFWKQAVIICICHWIIDLIKAYSKGQKMIWFFIDQLLHLIVIVLVWYLYVKPDLYFPILDEKTLIIALAFVFVTKPVSVIIKMIISKWVPDIAGTNETSNNDALNNAGEYIGIIERVLTVLLILISQWTAVGFLITAKSVFRFGDLTKGNDRKLTEYVLIGTLLSFGIAILIGVVTKYYLANYL